MTLGRRRAPDTNVSCLASGVNSLLWSMDRPFPPSSISLPSPFTPPSPPPHAAPPSSHTIPRTSPPTPTLSSADSFSTLFMLHQLTRAKLERAAQGQMSGRRGAPSLRECVLLSNVFGAARPQWTREQEAREREAVEQDRRRKEDEERWLDNLLEEMLEVEEEDDERDYVSVRIRGDNDALGDSGYLEETSHEPYSLGGLGMIEEELDFREPRASVAAVDDEGGTLDPGDRDDTSPPSPPSPPLPCRSPPIALRERPAPNPYLEAETDFDFDFESSSPPEHLPPLTPDCSPPGPASAIEFLGSGASSSEGNLDDDRDLWLERRSTTRSGILSVERIPPYAPKYESYDPQDDPHPLDIVAAPVHTTFEPLAAFGPPSPPSTYRAYTFPSDSSDSSLAVTPLHPSFVIPKMSAHNWTPQTPRSLSVPPPPAPRQTPTRRSPPSFHGGVVKSFYDCVDFGGGSPRAQLPASCGELPPSLSWAGLRGASRGRDDLAVVLASSPPLSPPFAGGMHGVRWRSRSLSPESGSRREWATLRDVDDDVDAND